MILYTAASPFAVFPYAVPECCVKAIPNGYITYRRAGGVNVAQSLFSTDPYDYISSKYFNSKNPYQRRKP